MKKEVAKGVLFVAGGAMSYGILATLVKLAYKQGYTTAEVTAAQYILGLVATTMFIVFNPQPAAQHRLPKSSGRDRLKLVAGGTAYGLTGIFYYYAVNFVPVSIAVVLLMQTIWMGVLLEWLLTKRRPHRDKVWAALVVLAGTVLATNAIENFHTINTTGVLWGLAAALTYTLMIGVANQLVLTLPPQHRSFWILVGATAVVLIIAFPHLMSKFDVSVFWQWGIWLALFGTILPPLLFNVGLPKTGIGLGSIIIAIEIPVSVGMAYLLLTENITMSQWLGVMLIIGAVVLANRKTLKTELKNETIPLPGQTNK